MLSRFEHRGKHYDVVIEHCGKHYAIVFQHCGKHYAIVLSTVGNIMLWETFMLLF